MDVKAKALGVIIAAGLALAACDDPSPLTKLMRLENQQIACRQLTARGIHESDCDGIDQRVEAQNLEYLRAKARNR